MSCIIALLLRSICRKEDIFIDTAGIGQGILNMNDIKVFVNSIIFRAQKNYVLKG